MSERPGGHTRPGTSIRSTPACRLRNLRPGEAMGATAHLNLAGPEPPAVPGRPDLADPLAQSRGTWALVTRALATQTLTSELAGYRLGPPLGLRLFRWSMAFPDTVLDRGRGTLRGCDH